MRIAGLSIDGFGVFNGATLKELPPGLLLFLGDNEAGKSTMLGFVHTVLFGYPDARTNEKDYPPLNGGTAGGRLILDTDARGLVTVERRGGPKGGAVTLTFPDGERGGTNSLEKILGGTNRKLFRNLYGFSLTELQTIETLTNEDVRDVIYGASLGTGLRTLPDARKRLSKRMGDLFKSGGSKPEMNELLKDLEETRRQLKDAQQGIAEYEAAAETIAGLGTTIEETRADLSNARARLAHVQALLKLWDDWIDVREAEAQLAALEYRVEAFPDKGLATLDALARELTRRREELKSEDEELGVKRQKLEGLAFDEALLEKGAEIAGLIQGLEIYEKTVQSIPPAEARVEERDADVANVLSELGSGWTEERALALDRSAHAREEISALGRAIADAERACTTRAAAVESCGTAHKDAKEEEKRAREKVEELEGAGLDVDRAVLAKLRNGRVQFSSVLTDLPRREVEHESAASSFTRTLREIDRDWTADTLEQLDVSLPAQQRIDHFLTQLQGEDAAVHDAQTRVQNAAAAVEKIKRTMEEKHAALKATGVEIENAADLEARRNQTRELQRAVRRRSTAEAELALNKQALEMVGAEPDAAAGPNVQQLLLFIAIGLVGVGVFLAAILLNADQKVAAGVSGLLGVLLAAVLMFVRRTLAQSESRRRGTHVDAAEAEKRAQNLTAQLDGIARDIGRLASDLVAGGTLDLADVDRLTDETDARIDQLGDCLRLAQTVEDLTVQLEQAENDAAGAEEALRTAEQNLSSTETDWQKHARSLHLPANTSPRTAGLVFAKAEKARGEKNRLDDLSVRITEMKAARADYLAVMAEVPRLEEVSNKRDEAILAALTTFLAEIDQQEDRLRDLELARTALEDAAGRTSAAAGKLEQAEVEMGEAKKTQRSAEAAWKQWLEGSGMDPGWSPDIAAHALDRVIRLAEIVGDRKSAGGTIARGRAEVTEYRQRVAAVFTALGRAVPTQDRLPVEIRRLEEDRAEHDTRHTRHAQVSDDLRENESRRESRRQSIEESEAKVAGLIRTGGAKDEADFRRRGEAFAEFGLLTARVAACESNIRKVSGTLDLGALRTELAEESRERLTAEEAALRGRLEETETCRADALERRGAAEKHQQTLYSDDRVAQLRAKEEGLLEDLATRARDWARHAVADHLLDAAKERHAQANQPRVIQEAGKYFETITGGRYTQVFAPPGENSMKVIDPDGRSKDADDLSRGSMEQLYLAIRFGYISAQSGSPEPLPILMDDVLVNFDPTRATAAASGILQMAESRQILFFTCHPTMVDTFRNQAPKIPVYEIAGADIRPSAST